MRNYLLSGWLVLVFVLPVALWAQAPATANLVKESYNFTTYDGQNFPAELFTLTVAARPGHTDSIRLKFVRLRTLASNPRSPLVFLAGGPGIPGIGIAKVPVYFSLFRWLQQDRDVILLDQRGCGMSIPNLQLPLARYSDTAFLSEKTLVAEWAAYVRHGVDSVRKTGIDLADYTMPASAGDIESIRMALGAPMVSLLGWSYGTALALEYTRRYGANLDKLVLMGTEGPDDVYPLPATWDAQITTISNLVARDSAAGPKMPDMQGTLKRVLARLDREPVTLTISEELGGPVRHIRVGAIGLLTVLRNSIGNGRWMGSVPKLVYDIDRGVYSGFQIQMEGLYRSFALSLMELAVDYSSGASTARMREIEKENRSAVLYNLSMQWGEDVAGQLGVPRRPAGEPVRSSTPTLFVTGSLDVSTPYVQAEAVRSGFPNSMHVLVENGGHETIPVKEVQQIVVDFLRGAQKVKEKVVLERVRFEPL